MKEVIWDAMGIASVCEYVSEAIGGIACAHKISEGRVDGLEHVFVSLGISTGYIVVEPKSIHPAFGGRSV